MFQARNLWLSWIVWTCLDIHNVNALKGRRLFQTNPNLGFMTWNEQLDSNVYRADCVAVLASKRIIYVFK